MFLIICILIFIQFVLQITILYIVFANHYMIEKKFLSLFREIDRRLFYKNRDIMSKNLTNKK